MQLLLASSRAVKKTDIKNTVSTATTKKLTSKTSATSATVMTHVQKASKLKGIHSATNTKASLHVELELERFKVTRLRLEAAKTEAKKVRKAQKEAMKRNSPGTLAGGRLKEELGAGSTVTSRGMQVFLATAFRLKGPPKEGHRTHGTTTSRGVKLFRVIVFRLTGSSGKRQSPVGLATAATDHHRLERKFFSVKLHQGEINMVKPIK